ncbi:MAG: UDP-N-acetylglucosamine 2-epimerase [actinobacterium acIB-AMD-7]|nr:MAG: UDP-N-acetylglucosamine 2-epimerase [actinobacterium acIB-AMD-7]
MVTGSRADYGLLKRLMKLIDSDPKMKLQIIVTGSHLSSKHGFTYKEIEEDGFQIDFKVDIIENIIDAQSTARAMSKAQIEITKISSEIKPDLMLVLGDRYEILSAVISALLTNVPVAHIHGGEVTTGAFDDSIRNAITKMSHLHFVATANSKNRVIQMGEIPANIFNFGGLGVDAIQGLNLLSKEEVEKKLGMKFGAKNLLVTYHPETISKISPIDQIQVLLEALSLKKEINLIFTGVNADPGSDEISRAINQFVQSNSNSRYYASLGQRVYLSTLLYCDGVVGNSSSGILEVPSFKRATVNIGNRQLGREMAESVINCELESDSIGKSIDNIYSKYFEVVLSEVSNPYGKGGASSKILEVIKKSDLSNLVIKSFHDL